MKNRKRITENWEFKIVLSILALSFKLQAFTPLLLALLQPSKILVV